MRILLAGLGGFIGSSLRYLIGSAVTRNPTFPIGTLIVNVAGCFAIGLLSWLADERGMFSADTRVFLFVGILGGFTTFSAFGNETMALLRGGHTGQAMLNIAAQLVLGLGAVGAGRAIVAAISQ